MQRSIKFSRNVEVKPYESIPAETRAQFENQIVQNVMNYADRFQTNGDAQFYARLLAYFYPRLLMKKYPNFRFREYTDIVKAAPYSKTMVFEQYDMIGNPKVKNQRAGDIGIVDTIVNELEVPFRSITGGIRWDYIEFKAASEAADGKAQFARLEAIYRFFEQKLNDFFFTGDEDYGLTGILNDPSIPTDAVATSWATATADQKLKDLLSTYTEVLKNSKNTFTPNKMMMSLSAFTSVFGQPRSVYSDESILSWVEKKLPGIDEIIADPYLDGAGPGGSDVIIALDKNPDYHNMSISMEMTGLPPIFDGTDYVFPFIARSTGFTVLQATSIYIKTGL